MKKKKRNKRIGRIITWKRLGTLLGIFGIYSMAYLYGADVFHRSGVNVRTKVQAREQNPAVEDADVVEDCICDTTELIIIYGETEETQREEHYVFSVEYFGMKRSQYMDTLSENEILLEFGRKRVVIRYKERLEDNIV